MSDEWNWRDPENHPDPPEEDTKTAQTDSNNAGVSSGTEEAVSGTEGEQQRQNVSETVQEDTSAGAKQEQSGTSGTYHWVNPRMQKNGGGQENTYNASDYRETVGGPGARTGAASSDGGTRQQGQSQWNQAGYAQGTGTGGENWGGYTQNTGASRGTWNQNSSPTGQRRYGDYQMGQERPAVKKNRKQSMGYGKRFLVTAGMAVVFGVIAGGIMFGVNYLGNELTGGNQQVEVPSTTTANEADSSAAETDTSVGGGEFSVAQVAENAMPSVVSITNASVQTVQDFFGGVQEYPIQSAGSGIVVGQDDDELLIATNNHVVEGAQTLTVSFSDASSYEAQIKGNDAGNDLAVIAVKLSDLSEETLSAVKVISLGDSDSLISGEQVVAIGNALG